MRSASYLLIGLAIITMVELFRTPHELPEETDKQHAQQVPDHLRVDQPEPAVFPQKQPIAMAVPTLFPPLLGTSVIGFKEALAFKESGGDYFEVNSLGYLGRYQFGIGTLKTVGVYDSKQFLVDPALQEKAFYSNLSRNKWILRREIYRFEGHYIQGIEITESGILAAAHLAGPGNVKRFLRSAGAIDVSDFYGTKLSDYLQRFSGYDLSEIAGKKNARI